MSRVKNDFTYIGEGFFVKVFSDGVKCQLLIE